MNIKKLKKNIKSIFWCRILIYYPYLVLRKIYIITLNLIIAAFIFILFLFYGFLLWLFRLVTFLKAEQKMRLSENISSFELSICNLCSSKEFRPYLNKNDWKLVKCRKCGLIFLNPRPTWKELRRMYGPNQYNYYVGKKKYINSKKEMLERYVETIGNIEKFKSMGKILEVGSATGYFLNAAKIRGWEVYGVEICKAGVEYAKREFAIEPYLGTLEEANFPSKFFDVIVMYHTLEHLTDPLSVLRETKRLLKDNGLVNISVPNICCCERIIQGKSWGAFELPSHLYCFSPRTLQKLVEKAGFAIVRGGGSGEINVFLKKSNSSTSLIPFWIKSTLEGYFLFLQINNLFKIYNIILSKLKPQS